MRLEEAWQAWMRKEIYKGNEPGKYVFPTEGSHFAAFKAGWVAAVSELEDGVPRRIDAAPQDTQ